ncbi:MAG: C-GCAxxG-C-C family protein, partial [Myxococcota bacterium]|nr:C-GCAxxG-C-C family protein [Myxococcota bacterium]
MDRAKRAVTQFLGPYNCTQSVLEAFAAEHGLESQMARRLATPFGAGFGHSGGMCGVVSGALLVIGLAHGQSDETDPGAKELTYAMAQEFIDEFGQRAGSVDCRVLVGVDMTDPVQ